MFFKKPERIEGLCCLMALICFVASCLEKILHKGLKQNGDTIPNAGGKPTSTPTLAQAFYSLRYLEAEVTYNIKENNILVTCSTLYNDIIPKILNAFGSSVQQYYKFAIEKTSFFYICNILKFIHTFQNSKILL
jgi:hypothetical protein